MDSLVGLHIVTPRHGSVLADGNLYQIKGTAIDAADGVVDKVEVAFDFDGAWRTAEWEATSEVNQWSYFWDDPTPGLHQIHARAHGLGDEIVEESISVEVRDDWSTAFAIDNPYATPGTFRKGQIHVHSTNSFDGWTSLPPRELALEYRRRGYSFIAITDHDMISDVSDLQDDSFAVIPAYESTSESGHITALWVSQVVSPLLMPQIRLDHITTQGGMAVLNHPGWQVGWSATDFASLKGYFGFEIYNWATNTDLRAAHNVSLWHDVLNAKGWANRIWAVAVDDAHEPKAIDHGWIQLKVGRLSYQAIRQALQRGAFYASNGPTFSELGVASGAIIARSPDAATIRFIDQDLRVVAEGPAVQASYRPTGRERWIRVEAVRADGYTAWSQPFWLLPNRAAV
jgi:hypothetical protein